MTIFHAPPPFLCRFRDVSLGYDAHAAVRGITFDIAPGDYLCIVGENGSGKTTLLKGLLRLLKPLSGVIEYSAAYPPSVAYVSQAEAPKKDFPASAYEIVLSGCIGEMGLRPFYTRNERARTLYNMERLGIESLARRCFRELSGGQQRRVLLARALCASSTRHDAAHVAEHTTNHTANHISGCGRRDRILVLDEPAAGLDAQAASQFYALLRSLNEGEGGGEAEEKVTIVMVSHDLGAVEKYARKIVRLSGGIQC